ncbi:MAG: folate-binding protein YgfZ [Hyphomonadaceae bacterium]
MAQRGGRAYLCGMAAPIILDRALIRASGPEAGDFLNNLVTRDLARLASAPVIYSGLLSPQGKVLADFFIWRTEDGFLIDADKSRGADLLRRLTLFRLRAKVELRDASAEASIEAYLTAPPAEAAADPRLAALGWRRIGPKQAPQGEAAYRAHGLALGVPDLALDAGVEEVFALEALFEELNGVDFQKGCFVGQENVSRMKRRATTRKKFCLVEAGGAAAGARVLAGEAEIGTVRAVGPGGALALLRLDRAQSASNLSIEGKPARPRPSAWLILPPAEGG